MTAPTIRAELAAAVRRVNADYARLPKAAQEKLVIAIDAVDAEVDSAIAAGDRDWAMRAIEGWRDHWLSRFEAVQQ